MFGPWLSLRALLRRGGDRLLDAWYLGDRALLGVAAIPVAIAAATVWLVFFAQAEHVRTTAEQQRRADLHCLAENVYHEGRGESLDGQYAVAEVTLNRVASPRFPGTVCAVVHEKRLDPVRGRYVGAFSWTELETQTPSGRAWQRAIEVAIAAYDGDRPARVPGALYYHATRVHPRWARSKQVIKRIGHHVFYP